MLWVFLPAGPRLKPRSAGRRSHYKFHSYCRKGATLSGNYATPGWARVFVSCIWKSGSPPWQGLEPHLPPPLSPPAVNGAFFTDRSDLPPMITTEKSSPVQSTRPLPPLLAASLSQMPVGESDTRHDGSSAERSTKLLTSPWTSFSFCVYFLFGQTRPHWRDFEIFWPTDNTNRVVKQCGLFISSGPEECTLKRRQRWSCYRLPCKWHSVASFRRLDVLLYKNKGLIWDLTMT